ncbi:MAG: cell surface protein SprA [Flavobacteriales bacterium]
MPSVLLGQNDSLLFPFNDNRDPLGEDDRKIYGPKPSSVETEVEYDPETGNYNYKQSMGGLNYSPPAYMSFDEYKDYEKKKSMHDYWKQIEKEAAEEEDAEDGGGGSAFRPAINVPGDKFDRIFGGNTIEIRPNGSAELTFAVNSSKTENPAIPVNQRRITTPDFRQNIQLNVIGNIGEKLKIQTNYNTQATFDFENQMKVEYTGYEDEIIQKIELGNVSLPLQSSLISGSQALFGVKTELKFGRLYITSVYSQQKSERREVSTEGGAQEVEFDVKADQYEDYRHYFLSHFFRDQYERALATPPIINSSVNVTRVEVWVTNTNFSTEETRNIIAFQDLGDAGRVFNADFAGPVKGGNLPASNGQNQVYGKVYKDTDVRGFTQASRKLEGPAFGLKSRFDYQKVELARKLEQGRDYSYNQQLGYISLVQEIQPNQVLAVAFEYTYNGRTYRVGEFSNDNTGSDALILKMLKSSELNTHFPMWDLMMKNVYSIGAYQLSQTGFEVGIWYLDKSKGIYINYLPVPYEGLNDRPLLQVMKLDRINNNNAQVPDGVFDFLANPQITVNPSNGRIFFPVLEPFGSDLRKTITTITGDPSLANQYAFDSLYTNTQANAQYNYPQLNRFTIRGTYQSSNSSEIALNAFNIPEGSVVVTAAGQTLVENQDYTVDYTLGRVKIINQGLLESGTPINVSLESNSAFGQTRRAMFASRFDYKVSDELNFGGTIMNLSERPLTQKVNYGDEPISNTVVGVDGAYSTESKFLTSMVDKIPLIETKAVSNVTVQAEAAKLFPGHSKAIGQNGNSYIDDFEGSQSTIDLRSPQLWSIASTPQGQNDLFPEGVSNDLLFNKNRARLAWYNIDNLFYRSDNTTPDHIKNDAEMLQNHMMRQVQETEVFPNRQFSSTSAPQNYQINMFDLAFYPEEPGPYNYDVDPVPGRTAGLDENGNLEDPASRWGGIMRRIDQTDFDAANIEFIQFWIMDPYAEAGTEGYPGSTTGLTDGELYFNIGNISEDVLKDEYKNFENGFPKTLEASTDLSNPENFSVFGRIPDGQQIVNAFDNNPSTREFQDVGLEGLRDEEETRFFDSTYLAPLRNRFGSGSAVYSRLNADPSHDNYNYYRDDRYDQQELNILERYKLYNGLEGNSATSEQSQQINQQGYPTSGSQLPNAEDINRDNTLDNVESYYQYKVEISPQALSQTGQNYINAIQPANPQNTGGKSVNWIQFKIPVREFEKKVGNIQDFRSIRFMRIYVKGFEKPIYLRFARLELVRGEWRRYTGDLDEPGDQIFDDPSVLFNVGAVNVEENSEKEPVNYILPPLLQREIQAGSPNLAKQNEQSLAIQVQGLEDGKAQAAFRNIQMDMRSFKKMEMYLHAESMPACDPVDNNDLRVFIRVGTDFTENYYEYETPVTITQPAPSIGYQETSLADQEAVWPLENNVIIEFEELFALKRERNENLGDAGGVLLTQRYAKELDAGKKIYVVGNPNLADARVVMIGVRNPKRKLGQEQLDDGLPKCAEIWANELRLTHFDQSGGEAALARISAQLADFAQVSVASQITTPGWGPLEAKVSEKQRETITNFDASAQVNLDKFVPEKTGIKVPMYVGYSNTTSTPQFAPEEPDTPMDIYLDNRTNDEKDSLLNISQKVTERRSLNFTNVRKERTGDGKPHFYDVSNWSTTYAFTETRYRDFNTEFDFTKNYRGGVAYAYSINSKSIEPFKNVGFVKKSKWLRLVKDFNFSLAPKSVGFRNDFDRIYGERKARNISPIPGATVEPQVYVNKSFHWDRAYNLSYDLSKAIKIDFSANNRALVREYEGERVARPGKLSERDDPEKDGEGGYFIDPVTGEPERDATTGRINRSYEQHKDSILSSLSQLGLTTNYNHTASVSYSVPLSKIPLLDWTSLTSRYSGTYDWMRGPLVQPGIQDTLGHTISNGQQIQLNGSLNMTSLYNKVPYLRDINRNKGSKGRPQMNKAKPDAAAEDSKEDAKKEKDNKLVKGTLKALMSVKSVSGTYTLNRGNTLPGFGGQPNYIGLDNSPDRSYGYQQDVFTYGAPGMGFIFGQQEDFSNTSKHFADYAGNEQRWLVANPNIYNPYLRSKSEQWNFRASVQPMNDLRIDLTSNESRGTNWSEYFRYNKDLDYWSSDSTLLETGNYSVSIISIATALEDIDSSNYTIYNQFLSNRVTVSQRLGEEKGISSRDPGGYTVGYDSAHQDVLIPAFLAAYTGQTPGKVSLNPLKTMMLPNWRINYTGLQKLAFIKKYFRSFSINHGYRSTYTVGGYIKSFATQDTFQLTQRIQPKYVISQVSISEQFSPLINFDMTWNNSLLTRFEIRRDRNITLSTSNGQVTEMGNVEYIVGSGYTFSKLKMPFTVRGTTLQSDLVLRADFSIRNSTTLIRKIVEEETQVTAGQRVYSLKLTGDYSLTKALTLRLFYDWVANRPAISNSFPTSNINAGFSLRFALSG